MTYPLPRFTGQEPCAQVGIEWYFTDGEQTSYKNLAQVQAACGKCPMQAECLDYALHVNVRGIWGGTTESERKVLRRNTNVIPHPTVA